MNKKAQNVGLAVLQEAWIDLAVGAIILIFFIYASMQYSDGSALAKLYIGEDEPRIISAWYAVPGNGFLVYPSEYNYQIKDNQLFINEGPNDQTEIIRKLVYIDKSEVTGTADKNLVTKKYGSSVEISSVIPSKYLQKYLEPTRTKKKNIDKIVIVYDSDSEIFAKSLAEFFNDAKLSTDLDKLGTALNIVIKKSDKLKITYSSLSDEDLRSSNFEFARKVSADIFKRDLVTEPIFVVAADYEYIKGVNGVLFELTEEYLGENKDITKDIRQQVGISTEEYYNVV